MSRLHVSGAILVALLAVAATVMPATASVDVVDYVSWRWPGPGPRGIGLIDTVPSTTGTFVELVGLEPALSYRVVASERGCNRTHRPVDEVISEQVTADANGAAFVDAPLNGAVDPRDIKSLRLFLGSSQTDCSKPQSYQVGSGPDGPPQEQMSLNIFSGAGGVYGMVTAAQTDESEEAVGYVLHGLEANTSYRLIGKGPICAEPPKPAKEVFRHTFTSNARGTAYSAPISKSFNCIPESVTLVEIGHGTVASTEGIIMANTEGDF